MWAEPAVLPGALLAVVQGDPSKEGLFVYRLKMPPGYRIPPHLHKASENVTVLSGDFFIGLGEKFDQGKGQELPVGGFLSVPPNHPHYAWVGGSETIVQVHGVGPDRSRFVNPEDDPRKVAMATMAPARAYVREAGVRLPGRRLHPRERELVGPVAPP